MAQAAEIVILEKSPEAVIRKTAGQETSWEAVVIGEVLGSPEARGQQWEWSRRARELCQHYPHTLHLFFRFPYSFFHSTNTS